MTRPSLLCICLLSAFTVHFVQSHEKFGSSLDVKTVENLTDFLTANPSIKLQPISKEVIFDPVSRNYQHTHYWGSRSNNDRLLATVSDRIEWPTIQGEYRFYLWYPKDGVSAYILNYLEVIIEQNSPYSEAYIVNGGMQQRSVTVLFISRDIHYFQYRASIYGYQGRLTDAVGN